MKRTVMAIAVVAIAGTVASGVVLLDGGDDGRAADEPAAARSTVNAKQRNLATYDETDASLVYTTSLTVSAPVEGTVTAVLDEGSTVDAGTVVGSIDGAPVVAMIGDVPGWRALDDDSDEGVDIRQLETNLVALGFDPDGLIEIDETFDEATEDAVEAWEESLGIDDPDGVVAAGQVVFVPGTVLIETVDVAVGAGVGAGSPLASGRLLDRRFPVVADTDPDDSADDDGVVVDHLAKPDKAFTTGTVLFWNDGLPVTAAVGDFASVPTLDRALSVGVEPGPDIELFESVLKQQGFDADGELVVDDELDDTTAAATAAWWSSLGVTVDGTPAGELSTDDVVVPAGSLVTVPSGLRVGGAEVAAGDTVPADRTVMWLTEPTRLVTATVPVGDDAFAPGAAVTIVLPDDTTVKGTVVDVGTVLSASASADDAATDDPAASASPAASAQEGGESTDSEPMVDVEILPDGKVPAKLADFVEVAVTVRTEAESAKGATTVPVTALVALAEGGCAVEVVTGGVDETGNNTKLVGVEVGLFASGFVEITGDVQPGDKVVVPS